MPLLKQGLLLIDVQQDYLSRAQLYPPAEVLIARLAELVQGCRDLGIPILHSRTIIDSSGSNLMPHRRHELPWACREGTPGCEPPPALAAEAFEPILSKPFFSAFGNPELHARLQAAGIETLYVAGIYTHACVRASVLDAYQLGYRVCVVSDCIASTEPLHASLSIQWLSGRACVFQSCRELLQTLQQAPTTEAGARLPSETTHDDTALDGHAPRHGVAYFGGQWLTATGQPNWTANNPSHWSECLGQVPLGGPAEVSLAAVRAAAAQGPWQSRPVTERLKLLEAWAAAISARQSEFVSLLAREVGKPLADGKAEVSYGLGLLQATISRLASESDEMLAADLRVRHRPLGTVGLITPWNNPLAIPIGKLAPALAFGNTVVWKPALQAAGIVTLLLQTLVQAGLPADCVTVVLGDADTARALPAQPEIKAISFTGSIPAGQELAVSCALYGKALQAELGGNNAVIVSRSADVAAVARELATAVYSFAGQRCTAPRRLIVAREIQSAFTEAFISAAQELQIGVPTDPAVQLGPMISRQRQALMQALVTESLYQGAELLLGGRIPPEYDQGCWFEPTLLSGLNPAAPAVKNEAFGPVAVLLPAQDFSMALDSCNAVEHGLSASLYSQDPDEVAQFLAQAEAGILRINHHQGIFAADGPFGGWKASGLGIPEHGRWDQEFYTRAQAVYGQN